MTAEQDDRVKVLINTRVLGHRPDSVIETDRRRAEHIVQHGLGEYVKPFREVTPADVEGDSASIGDTPSVPRPRRSVGSTSGTGVDAAGT